MNVALIPVRGGSKSIHLKNIKEICGKPLVYWTIQAACDCKYIDKVYISTDNEEIRDKVLRIRELSDKQSFSKINVISRSVDSASDTASTEFVMLEFSENYSYDNIVLIQATSPMLQEKDLDRGFEVFSNPKVDSVLSVVRQKRFNWTHDDMGFAHPTNYDVYKRPRRQDFDGYLVENGAFYITSRKSLIDSQNRLSGNIKAVEMCEDSFFEIDEPDDWEIVEFLLNKKNNQSFFIPPIKMVLADCDGCLTDGGMYYSEKGDELKKFNTRDGKGFELLQNVGILTGIVTSESVELNRRRAEKLNLDILEIGIKDKKKSVERICDQYGIDLANVCYIGDDINV